MITTTLNRIARTGCLNKSSWARLLESLGKTTADDEPLSFARIVEVDGLGIAIWCCEAEPQYAREWRLFFVWCCRRVEHSLTDQRSRDAINVAERYANGQATDDELVKACAAAKEASADYRGPAAWMAEAVASKMEHGAATAVLWARKAAGICAWSLAAETPELAAQTAEFLRIVTETEART